MKTIRFISSSETYPLRSAVLREGKPFSECIFEGDDDNTTFHLGYFWENQIIGIATCLSKSNRNFDSQNSFQVRGMAVSEDYRGQKVGEKLIRYIENHIISRQEKAVIWLNAREKALSFYQKLGYENLGTPFEVEGIGIHYLMYKYV